jgi:hypothetical protein
VHEAHPVAVHRAQQHDEAGEFEQRLAFGLRAGTEVKRRRILEHQQERDLAFLDELFAVRFAEPRGDVPVDVPHIVAELILHHLIELHAASAKRRAVLAAEDVLHRMPHPPFELPQEREWGGGRRRGGGRRQRGKSGSLGSIPSGPADPISAPD